MSYDIRLVDEEGHTLRLPKYHNLNGGIFAVGGTRECWMNITYNYSAHFKRVIPPNINTRAEGIRALYGSTGEQSIPVLKKAIEALAFDEGGYSYWEATEGNARRALENLLALAELQPSGIWRGD